eukprot:scaffold8752_cov160-Amphora_coffeaeformis.AAC.3
MVAKSGSLAAIKVSGHQNKFQLYSVVIATADINTMPAMQKAMYETLPARSRSYFISTTIIGKAIIL